MIFMIVYLFSVVAALGLGVLAGWSDYKGMTIPNYIVALVITAFVLAWGAAHFAGVSVFSSIPAHLSAVGLALVITFIMFSVKMIGGGDSKLATAFALWAGLEGLVPFLFYMAVAGAVIGLIAIFLKKKKPVKNPREGGWIARVQGGESVVPYGIPIALGAFAACIQMKWLAPETLSLFLVSN